jgi:hypothetical protein
MSDAIRVNGNIFSWGSIILKINNERFYGFNSVTYADKRERTKGYGMGKHHAPRSRSRGKYSADNTKLGGPKSTIQAFRAMLAAQSSDGKSYGDVEFQISVQYIEQDETPITVSIEGCVWAGNSTTDEENAEQLKEEIEVDVMIIRRNTLVLFDNSEGVF